MSDGSFRGETDCAQFTDPPIDYIVAVECIYLEDLFDALLQSMVKLCGDDTRIVVAFMKRRKADSKFWKKAAKLFDWNKVATNEYTDAEHDRVQIHVMTKKSKNKKPQS